MVNAGVKRQTLTCVVAKGFWRVVRVGVEPTTPGFSGTARCPPKYLYSLGINAILSLYSAFAGLSV